MKDVDKARYEKMQHDAEDNWSYETSMKNWRAWGSWFSWGSPIGLSIFLLSLCGCVWILMQAFK